MSIVLADEELLRAGAVYGFNDDTEEEEEKEPEGDIEEGAGGLDDEDLLSGVGLDDEVFGEDEDEDDPFVAGDDSDEDEEE